ncbi:MAG: response regulator transcription factor [Bacteriovoracaceae bacterium]
MRWTLVYFDDDSHNLDSFHELLKDDFRVIGCSEPELYSKIIETNHIHGFLIDVHMPIIDGFSLYEKIIDHPFYNGCPIFFISGDQSDENKIKSYRSGGVDFLSREMKCEELVIRLTNRVKFHLHTSTKLELGNLKIDIDALKVTLNQRPVELTLIELRILSVLLRGYPGPLSRSDVIRKIWVDDIVKPGTINTHIANLRPKIADWDHVIKIKDEFISILPKD